MSPIIALSSLLLFGLEPQVIEVPAGDVYEWPGEAEDFVEVDEIQLGESAELHFPEFKSIRIRKLIASDGSKIKIAQNTSGEDAAPGAHGGDEAKVVLFIASIAGHVVVEAKGGNGGDGLDGRHGQQGVPGGKGRDGLRFFFFYFGDGEDGYPGGSGEDGQDGQDGGNGGNGGNVRIYYRNKTPDSQILVEVDGGRGGRGGKAGMGGLGGNGGPGGKGLRRGKQGPMGAPGKNAKPGRPGIPGEPGSVSIFQVDRDFYRCLLEIYLTGAEPLSKGCG